MLCGISCEDVQSDRSERLASEVSGAWFDLCLRGDQLGDIASEALTFYDRLSVKRVKAKWRLTQPSIVLVRDELTNLGTVPGHKCLLTGQDEVQLQL